MTARLWGTVLAGGSGTRFWPLSTPGNPKQFLPLVTEKPLLDDTVARFDPLVPPDRTLILTGASLMDAVRSTVPAIPSNNVFGEPRPAGTAAALAFAAKEIEARDPGAIMCCVHADWSVADADGFRDALATAATLAVTHDALVTVGIVPTRPETGYGYIVPGQAVESGARRVSQFAEKPDRTRAASLISRGALWNSGIFVWKASRFLAEVREFTPEVSPALAAPLGDIAAFFAKVKTPVSVDVGVLERSSSVLVLPGDFGWDDVGTWASLRRVRAVDSDGNATQGDVVVNAAHGNVAYAMAGGSVVLYGVDDLVVVTKPGLTVVTTIERAADLKSLLETLPDSLRDQP